MAPTQLFRADRSRTRLAHLDLPGGGQVCIDGNYAYVGHVGGKSGPNTTILDVADPKHPKVVGTLKQDHPDSHSHKVSELDSPWSRTPGGRFGAHQFHEHADGTLIYATWFSGGLRIIDLADPSAPREVGHFIPEPVGGNRLPQSNDVYVDRRGLIYLLDRNAGFDILENGRT